VPSALGKPAATLHRDRTLGLGVTQRHDIRRLGRSALVAAADRVSARIAAALKGGGEAAEVIPFRPGA
jgi:hypothetical protein